MSNQPKKEIQRIYDKNHKRYGSPRIHQQLLREGYAIGWSLRESLTKDLVIAALNMALKGHNLSPALLLHSDQGIQYVSELYQLHLLKNGIICSMSGKGNC